MTACVGIQTDSENSNLRGPLRTDLHFSVLDCAERFEIFVAVCSNGSAIHDILPETKGSRADCDSRNVAVVRRSDILSH